MILPSCQFIPCRLVLVMPLLGFQAMIYNMWNHSQREWAALGCPPPQLVTEPERGIRSEMKHGICFVSTAAATSDEPRS